MRSARASCGHQSDRYMRANRDGTIPILMSPSIDKGGPAAYDSFYRVISTQQAGGRFRRVL